MEQNLTDRSFWKAFWESKKDLIFYIKPDYVFGDLLAKLIEKHKIKNKQTTDTTEDPQINK